MIQKFTLKGAKEKQRGQKMASKYFENPVHLFVQLTMDFQECDGGGREGKFNRPIVGNKLAKLRNMTQKV